MSDNKVTMTEVRPSSAAAINRVIIVKSPESLESSPTPYRIVYYTLRTMFWPVRLSLLGVGVMLSPVLLITWIIGGFLFDIPSLMKELRIRAQFDERVCNGECSMTVGFCPTHNKLDKLESIRMLKTAWRFIQWAVKW